MINGNYIIGTYPTEIEAAVAYNKACDILKPVFPNRTFRQNIIRDLSPKDYAKLYLTTEISQKIIDLANS